jgi:hypothetical protein
MKINAQKIFMGKPEGTQPLGTLRRRWENNIKMNFKETYVAMAWTARISLTTRTCGGSCDYGNEPWGSTKCGELLDCVSNS